MGGNGANAPTDGRRRGCWPSPHVAAVAATPPARARASVEAAPGGTLVVTAEGNPDFLDSGFAYAPESWQILVNTGDGLMAFRRAAGQAGAQVVPDLAAAPPAVCDDGRVYTFTCAGASASAPRSAARCCPAT